MGLERQPVVREGDLSRSGVFVRLDVPVGEPGAVCCLRLKSRDRLIRVEVEARVIRVDRHDDLLHGTRVSGVAFEFLCVQEGVQEEIDKLFEHVVRSRAGAVDRANVSGLSVETGWRLKKGERIRVEVPSPNGGTVKVEGRAVRSRQRASGDFRTKVELLDEEPASEEADDTLGLHDALAAATHPPPPEKPHLSGELSHVPLTSVLSVASFERITGELRLRRGVERAVVFLRDGQVVDCEGAWPEQDPRECLGELVGWSDGTFELTVTACERPDRVDTPTTALLLELARAADEKKRVA